MSALILDYDLIKSYYDRGLWSITRVRNAVVKEVVTAVQFLAITGQTY